MERKTVSIVLSQVFSLRGGGKEVEIHNLSQEIKKRGISPVEIVCFGRIADGDLAAFDRNYDIPIYRIWSRWIEFSYSEKDAAASGLHGGNRKLRLGKRIRVVLNATIWMIMLTRLASRRISTHRGKVILLHCHSLVALAAAVFCRRLLFPRERIRIIFLNGFVSRRSGFRLADYVVSKLLAESEVALCVSEASARALVTEFGYSPARIKHVMLWIDDWENEKLMNAEPDQLPSRSADTVRILFVGRIVPEKGVGRVMDLARHIDERGFSERYEINVVGVSLHPICEELRRVAESLKCLKYHGRVQKPHLWKYYRSSDVFVMPSIWQEGAGYVNLEAYAFGLPVVGADVGGIPEYIKPFRYHRILEDFAPAKFLEAIDSLYEEVSAVGKREVLMDSRRTLKKYFSPANFREHQAAYEDVAMGARG